MEGKSLLILIQKLCLAGVLWEIPESEERETEGAGPFNEEKIAPVIQLGVDMENPECQQTREGIGDIGGSVKDGETACEFSTSIERSQVIDDGWEEG